MRAQQLRFHGNKFAPRLVLVILATLSSHAYQCVGQQPAEHIRITDLMNQVVSGDIAESSIAYGVLCSTQWPHEHQMQLSRFIRENYLRLPLKTTASGLRQIATSNHDAAIQLRDITSGLISTEISDINLNLIITLRSTGTADKDCLGKLEELVKLKHSIISPQAAATLLKIGEDSETARAYLNRQLQSGNASDVWRAIFAFSESTSVFIDSTERICDQLSHPDTRVCTMAAYYLVKNSPPGTQPKTANAILAGLLCVPDEAIPTEFVYPSNPGRSHRLYIIAAAAHAGDYLSYYWPPLLGIILSNEPRQAELLTRIRALEFIGEQDNVPQFVSSILSTLQSDPESFGLPRNHTLLQELLVKFSDQQQLENDCFGQMGSVELGRVQPAERGGQPSHSHLK